jgi:hypothetical protein
MWGKHFQEEKMKSKVYIFLAILVLVLASISCGSSDDGVVVNPPSDNEPEQSQPEQTDPPKVGTSRSNPAPVGSEVVVDDMAFTVLDTIRPADDIIKSGNQFNTEPESDQEYILVKLEVGCEKSVDEKCIISSFWNISLIGSSGVASDPELLTSGVEGLLESEEFYGGASVSGMIPFIINKTETDLVLIYEPLLFGDTIYLAVP